MKNIEWVILKLKISNRLIENDKHVSNMTHTSFFFFFPLPIRGGIQKMYCFGRECNNVVSWVDTLSYSYTLTFEWCSKNKALPYYILFSRSRPQFRRKEPSVTKNNLPARVSYNIIFAPASHPWMLPAHLFLFMQGT